MKTSTYNYLFSIILICFLPLVTFGKAKVVNNEPVHTFVNGIHAYTDAVFINDGIHIAASNNGQQVNIFDKNGKIIRSFVAHTKAINAIDYNIKKNLIATASEDKTIKLYSTDGQLITSIKAHHKPINDISFSRFGNLMASASDDKTVKLWNNKGKLIHVLKGHSDAVNSVMFSPDGNYLISASDDNKVIIWTINGELLNTLNKFYDTVNSVHFSRDGNKIITTSGNSAQVWTKNGKLLVRLAGHTQRASYASFSNDGNFIVTASDDGIARLWKTEGELLFEFRGHKRTINSANFSPYDNYIVTTSNDKTVKIWETGINKLVQNGKENSNKEPQLNIGPKTLAKHNTTTVSKPDVAPSKQSVINSTRPTHEHVNKAPAFVEQAKNTHTIPNIKFYNQPIDNIPNLFKPDAANGENPKVWAVVVGVGQYDHIRSLQYAKDDAYLMYAFLKSPEGGALPDEQIKLLIDGNATKDRVLRAMRQVYSKASASDVVLFYFAGHGLQTGFLPHDYDGFNNIIGHGEIYDIFKDLNVKHKLCIADACHSGNLMTYASRNTESVQNVINKYYTAFDNSQGGMAILLSSKGEEKSVEFNGLRQGVFSHFLIRGLKGEADINSDQVITILELFHYIDNNVRSYTNHQQSPTLFGDFDKNMPVSSVRR